MPRLRLAMVHLAVRVAPPARTPPERPARIAVADMGFSRVNMNTQAGGVFQASNPAAEAASRRRAKRRAAVPANALKQ